LSSAFFLNSGVFPETVVNPRNGAPYTSVILGKDWNMTYNDHLPDEVPGIQIQQKAGVIHFLHSSTWSIAPDGTEVARYIIYFTDDSHITVPVVLGENVVDSGGFGDSNHKSVVWRGFNYSTGGPIKVCRYRWPNPHPEKTISHIDFISSKTNSSPGLLGITLE
jgi:hypothetical protein